LVNRLYFYIIFHAAILKPPRHERTQKTFPHCTKPLPFLYDPGIKTPTPTIWRTDRQLVNAALSPCKYTTVTAISRSSAFIWPPI